jgi:DNA-binding CsgD family transcriptional regulator
LAVIISTFFFKFSTISPITFITNALYILFLVLVLFIIWQKGNNYALYLLWAWLAYAISTIILVFHNQNIIEENFWTSHILQISSLLDVILLSLAMSKRYKYLNQKNQEDQLKMQALLFEKQIKEKENDFLQEKIRTEQLIYDEKIAFKERELTAMAMQLLEKTNLMEDIQKQMQQFGQNESEFKKNIQSLSKKLRQNIDFDDNWENFKLHFEKVHPQFFLRLTSQFLKLTNNDLKSIAYFRINLAPKDIARLLNIDVKSIKMLKYRLKKKLNLTENDDLIVFIKTF